MSPKNAIKMKNIQNYYSFQTGSIRFIMSSSVQFGPNGPNWSIWSYLVHSVH